MKSVWRPQPGRIAALFIGLLLVAVAERRHAELYVTRLDRVAFENADFRLEPGAGVEPATY